MKRTLIMAVTAALALGVPSAHALRDRETRREQSQRTISARGVNAVEVDNARGLIQVRPSPDSALHLTALKIIHAPRHPRAQAYARETRVEATMEAGRLVVRVRYPQRQQIRISFWDLFKGDFEVPRVELRLALDVPGRLPVVLKARSGDIETADLAGSQSITTTSGDVAVVAAHGPLRVETSSGEFEGRGLAWAQVRTRSGDVSVEDAAGPLDVQTGSGELTVEGASDSLVLATTSGDVRVGAAPRGVTLTTGSGDVDVSAASGVVRVETTSGDVEAALRSGLQGARVATGSGDVRVKLAPVIGGAIELRTSSGALEVSLPIDLHTANRRQISGVIRNGRVPIHVHTTSGDIDVMSGGN